MPIILVVVAVANGGCATVSYYGQAMAGQARLLVQSRDIHRVIARGDVDAETAGRLAAIQEMRRFAVDVLSLPDSGSYRRYVALDREHVVWNVVAAPEFSTQPVEWCFPVAGCVAYRGYFSEQAANDFAALQARAGLDVFVGGVDAYSTLGYLPDPVLSSFIDYSDAEVAALLFHELAHQQLYLRGDTAFNESFATTVEEEGVRRWLAARGDSSALAGYRRRQAYRQSVTGLMLAYREKLEELYARDISETSRKMRKDEILDGLYHDYVKISRHHEADVARFGYARGDFNNALVSSFSLYHQWVPAFRRLLDSVDGDLPSFYRSVEAISEMTGEERRAILGALTMVEEDSR